MIESQTNTPPTVLTEESQAMRREHKRQLRAAEQEMKAPYGQTYPEAHAVLKQIRLAAKEADLRQTVRLLGAFSQNYPTMVSPDSVGLPVNAFLATPFRKVLIPKLFDLAETAGTLIAAHETGSILGALSPDTKLAQRLQRHHHYFEVLYRTKMAAAEHGPTQAAQWANAAAEGEETSWRRNNLIKIAQRFIDLTP